MGDRTRRIGDGRARSRSRLAAATWRPPASGLLHGELEVDVTEAEAWWRARPGLTETHVVGCALGLALAACPDANARVVLGRVRPRDGVDVSFAVADRGGRHLRAVCVRGVDGKPPRVLARELYAGARAIREGRDPQLGRAVAVADRLPWLLLRPGLSLVGFVTGGLGLGLRPLGVAAHPFGSALVTSVGMLGIERGLAPLLPFARLGLVLVVGSVAWQPRVVAGEVVPRRVLPLGATIDHRLVDGAQIAVLVAELRDAIERPWDRWPDA
ncbi:MAG: 2-oxo acid dehydrogenase subunit E2 [Thermoleophilia bacterium]